MKRLLSSIRTARQYRLPPWVDIVAILVALGIFSMFVLPGLTTDSAYFDEGYSAYLAHLGILQAAHYTSLDVHPPLYYATLHVWQSVFGSNITTLRLMSLAWAGIAIVFAFLIARRAFSRRAAWAVLACLTFSPLLIRYSEAARMYTMALALCLAATYILIRLSATVGQSSRRWLWVIYGILLALGMWTNYFTALVWASHAVWLAYEQFKLRRRFLPPKGWWAAAVLGIILYLPWLPMLVGRYEDVQQNGFWIAPVSVDTFTSTITINTVFQSARDTYNWLAVGVALWLIVTILLVISAYRQQQGSQRPLFRLLLIAGIGPIILLVLMSLPPFRPAYTYRYILTGVSTLTVLLGVSLALVKFHTHHATKKTIVSVLVIGTLATGALHAQSEGNRNLDTGAKSMVAQTIARIDQVDTTRAPIITYSPYTYYAASVYETPAHAIYYSVTKALYTAGVTRGLYDMSSRRGISNMQQFLIKYPSVWIVAEDKPTADKPPAPSWHAARVLVLNDPQKNTPSTYATEYRAP